MSEDTSTTAPEGAQSTKPNGGTKPATPAKPAGTTATKRRPSKASRGAQGNQATVSNPADEQLRGVRRDTSMGGVAVTPRQTAAQRQAAAAEAKAAASTPRGGEKPALVRTLSESVYNALNVGRKPGRNAKPEQVAAYNEALLTRVAEVQKLAREMCTRTDREDGDSTPGQKARHAGLELVRKLDALSK